MGNLNKTGSGETLMIWERGEADAISYALLYLADPSGEAVRDYIKRGICYLAEYRGEIIGEYVLLKTRPFTMELVNIAVAENWQGKGVGK